MKTVAKIFSVLLITLTLFSCQTTVKQTTIVEMYMGLEFKIIEVDSCEYLTLGGDSRTLTHKGNFKYCNERLFKLLK